MDLPKSAKRLKRVGRTEDGAIVLEDANGKRSTISGAVTDDADGITDADFDFESGKQWSSHFADDKPATDDEPE